MAQTYCVQDLFNLVDISTPSPKPSLSSIRAYWRALLRWIESQLVFDRKILIPGFGFVTFVITQDSKTFVLQILTTFLNQNFIEYKDEYQQYTKPVISLHYTAISKMLQKHQESSWLSKTLDRLFASILNLIATENANIDLGILGKLMIHDKVLSFQPFVATKKRFQHRTTVSKLVINKENSFRIKNKSIFCEGISIDQNKHKLTLLNQSSIFNPYEELRGDRIPFSPNVNSSGKKNLNPDFTKHLDMLGEVSDPLGRDYNFSDLTKSPRELLGTTFVKSTYCKPRFPPILDSSVRTLSAPITNQKYNLSISGRIGCNYNTSARSLYFDHKSRSIKNYIHIEGIKFKAQPSLLQTPATNTEQLLFICEGREEFRSKVEARRKCYERYNQYIQKQISHELVNSVDHSQIQRILVKSGVNSTVAKNPQFQQIIDCALEVVVKDHYYSGRKAILDYALKDPDERKRIGIVQILHQYPAWGESIPPLVTLSEFSKKYIRYSKSHISQHLLLSTSALKIKHQWKQFGKQLLLDLPSKSSSTNLLYFIKKQQEKISSIRTLLREKWRESVIDLMKEEIKVLKHKHQVISLQRLVNTLMSNLLREIIESSMGRYLGFFQQFECERYSSVGEILGDESVKSTFLSVKIKDEGGSIVFAESLNDHVKSELLGLLEQMIGESREFPSASIKNTFLWEITNQDQVYKAHYQQISLIIDANLSQVSKSIQVYKQHQYLLSRQIQIQQWCTSKRHSIQQYLAKLNQNRSLSSAILNDLPFTIRMNMVLVDGTDLKKKFIAILDEVEQQLYLNIYHHIKLFYNEVKSRAELIKSSMQLRVDSTSRLLEIQEKMYKIKRADIPEIRESFNELKQWMNLLFNEGSPLLVESDLMEIYFISKNISNLSELLVVEEQRVGVEKEELERELRREQVGFLEGIQRFEKEIKGTIKEFTVRKQAEYYNKLIRQFVGKLNEHLGTRQSINVKEEHLGWGITRFPELQHIHKIIQPPKQFWGLVMTIDTQLKEWGVQPIKNLSPETIESTVDKNISDLKRIYYNQVQNDSLPNLIYGRVSNQLLDLNEKYLPLIKIFANKGLKQRHWEAFAKQFAICENKESLTLNKVMGYKMADEEDKIDILIEISETASKEFVIEKSKSKMVEEWYPLVLVFKEFNDSGIMIIGSQIEPITVLLEEQLEKIHGMRELEEAKIFDQSLIEWELWLRFTQSLFAEWIKVQNLWCYLYPLYCDHEVVKNFPLEHAEFESITNSWKSIIRRIQEQPRIVEFTKNKKMLDIFLENNMKLSVMEHTISTFLTQKNSKAQETTSPQQPE